MQVGIIGGRLRQRPIEHIDATLLQTAILAGILDSLAGFLAIQECVDRNAKYDLSPLLS